MTATAVAQTSGDKATVRNVASHMTHTAETAKRFYQHLQGRESSVTAYATINKNKRTLEEENKLTHSLHRPSDDSPTQVLSS